PAAVPTRAPLAARPATSLRRTIDRDTAALTTSQAAIRAAAITSESPDAVVCTRQVDAIRYRGVIRARRPVDVRGAGFEYDGTYYVKDVTHQIRRGEYKQSFTLVREGTGALTPRVNP